MNRTIVFLLLSVLLLVGLAGPVLAASSESELFNRANELKINSDFKTAATLLTELLQRFPNTQNEDVYWELKEIYENKLSDYGSALGVYREYLRRFPQGRFAKDFLERVGFLEKNRKDWEAIRGYNHILETAYTREIPENLKQMKALLAKYPNSSLVPDIHSWLATQYYLSKQYEKALTHVRAYLATFPKNGKTDQEAVTGYKQCAQALMYLHRYDEALEVLKGAYKYHLSRIDYARAADTINLERREWYGCLVAIICLIGVGIFLIILKPWQSRKFKFEGKKLLWLLWLALVTLIPMFIIDKLGFGIFTGLLGNDSHCHFGFFTDLFIRTGCE